MTNDRKDTQPQTPQITVISSELPTADLAEIIKENTDSVFVLQQMPTPASSLFKTYTNILGNGNELEILATNDELNKRYTLWVDMGTNFTLVEYDFMNAFYYCSLCIAERKDYREVRRNIQDNTTLTQDRIRTYLKALYLAYFTIDDITNTSVYGENPKRDEIIEFFLKYDDKCLERLYQVRLNNLREVNVGNNFIVLADDRYIDGIKRINEDPNYRTPLLGTAKLKRQIKNLLNSNK